MGCKNKDGKHRKPKSLPYGATKGVYWCRGCDADLVPDWRDKPKKKQAREKAKRQIRKELKDIGK